MSSISLTQIKSKVARRLSERKALQSYNSLLETLQPKKAVDLRKALKKEKINIIAEFKRASPSEGPLALAADPVDVARGYIEGGAWGLSVLTEQDYFMGHPDFISLIRKALPSTFILMKDFVLEEYQILEGLKNGATSFLIILAMVGEKQAQKLLSFGKTWGLIPLVEVHTTEEMKMASSLGAEFIGVNNRNLQTMEVDLKTSEKLVALAQKNAILVSESGLSQLQQLKELQKLGYSAFLVGTHFMKTKNPGLALTRMLEGT